MFNDISSVLPRHSSEFERALEQASLWVIQQSEIVDVWNPDTVPEKFLPWLAWSVSVDEWDPDWTNERKREVIRQSVVVHRLKGTKGTVRRALEAIGLGPEITEWFENNGPVHTFQIDAFADDVIGAGYTIGPELFAAVSRQIDHVKPARSHYDLRIGERFRSAIYLRTQAHQRRLSELKIDPDPSTTESRADIYARSLARVIEISEIDHDPEPRTEIREARVYARAGARQIVISEITHNLE